jgi:serine/threonine protein kinase
MSDPGAAEHGGNVLLCDFGMAEYIPSGGNEDRSSDSPDPYEPVADRRTRQQINISKSSNSVVGSLEYSSPESLLSSTGLLSTAADIWAFGVVIYALLVGNLPFRHTFLPRVQMMILKGDWDETALRCAPEIGDWSDDAVELIRGCLEMDPDLRMTVRQVLNSSLLFEEVGEMEEVRQDRIWML